MSRYRHVSAMKAEGFPIAAACAAAEISASAYYEWLDRSAGPTDAEFDEALLINEMHKVHDTLDDTYGSPRMTDELRRRGHCVNHKRVERLMADNGLYAKDGRRRKVRTTIPDVSAPPLPDLVRRDFSVGEPGERTCGDITYIGTDEGWLYLADVLDLGSRTWSATPWASGCPTSSWPAPSRWRWPREAATSPAWSSTTTAGPSTWDVTSAPCADKHKITQSVGRIGSSQDNAAAESFWASLKRELISRYRFAAVPTLVGQSSPGSTTTTPCGCTARSATFRQSSGNYATHAATYWPHNHVSG